MHLATVFTAGRVLHGRLAAVRPKSAHLTTFYLWIAVGGVLGGVVNALVRVPLGEIFDSYYGALLLAKTGALIVLGGFGYAQRRHAVADAASGRRG